MVNSASNYINSSFKVIGSVLSQPGNINSSSPYTNASWSIPISTTGGWNVAAFCYRIVISNSPTNGYSFAVSINYNSTHMTGYTISSYYSTSTTFDYLNFRIIGFQTSALQVSG